MSLTPGLKTRPGETCREIDGFSVGVALLVLEGVSCARMPEDAPTQVAEPKLVEGCVAQGPLGGPATGG